MTRRAKTGGGGNDKLWAQFGALLAEAGRVAPPRAKRTRAKRASTPSPGRLNALRRALASADLARVRELIPDGGDANRIQQVVIHAYACLLETNSAGLAILFDRFGSRERRRIASALDSIGARGPLGDLRRLERDVARAKTRGRSRAAASEWLAERPATKRVNRKYERHVAEVEAKLLRFCNTNVEQLAR